MLLLPDARVLIAGGLRLPGEGPEDDEASVQFYSPPYLYHPPRPVITDVNFTTLPYGDEFNVTFDVNSVINGIDHVVLVRNSTMADKINPDQRLLELDFTESQPGVLCVQTPPNTKDAPEGYYMLFVLEERLWRTEPIRIPSVAEWVRLQTDAADSSCAAP